LEAQVKPEKVVNFDFAALELRVAQRANLDSALQLPRQHPMRFALLYGCGRDYLRKACLGMQYDMGAERVRDIVTAAPPAVRLETEILLFERWQAEEAGRRRRENAAIEYAAAEAGIAPSNRARRNTDDRGTITGRIVHDRPTPWDWTRLPLEEESDIERDRR
jgi:hypothetical protein